ncbi:MAG TPA: VanZ family protein [Thermoanaerobaculia bacterium]|nr:VanZ family protein [Thermoanaerobaculia bacterium]
MKRARIAAALWGGFLLLLTSWPNPPAIPAGGFPLDKLTHFVLYGVEAFLIDRAFPRKGRPGLALGRVLAITGVMALWGMLDEAHQEWIPGRRMDSGDLLADVSGAVGGAVAAGVLSRVSKR